MAIPALIDKLSKEFEIDITTERQVVYILVETRKLLEQKGQKAHFPVLTFCCDWALHTKLSGAFARKVIGFLNDYQELFDRTGRKIDDAHITELFNLTDQITFREQFFAFLSVSGLPVPQLVEKLYRTLFARFAGLPA
jgi:hypothetical protein